MNWWIAGIILALAVAVIPCAGASKTKSIFMPAELRERAMHSIARSQWAADLRDQVVTAAEPWRSMSDGELWSLMFGPKITRSWMVWSNGHCPACKQSVPMYSWVIKAVERPWKLSCPHCEEVFPKNDFGKFYQSGLDEHGVFDPARADRSLLFNEEHPDAGDSLSGFGVDDGEGYVSGDDRWRFIGAYLIYGQWKQAVLGGAKMLAAAYTVTGDQAYAHKAGVILDRVADLYPEFDFKTQAVIYEKRLGSNGYVSVWHDACEEARELALAYDEVFEGLQGDDELVTFLSAKAREFGLENPKSSFADIQRNIEERILQDTVNNAHKIASNYPRTPIALANIKAILGWPGNRDEVLAIIEGFLNTSTAVDGVTGEKGLANYSAFGLQSTAIFLARWDRAVPGFLDEMLKRQPRLHDMYRFHIDTWCMAEYYPLSGDSGWFARRIDQYQGVRFQRPGAESGYSHKDAILDPSMYSFMWRLYELTGDAAFVQALHIGNDCTTDGLPHDLLAADPESLRQSVAEVIAREGGAPKVGNINKKQWRLAIMRSGDGPHARAAWLDYDSGGGHSHRDGMNLGLFAYGLDLMPDFGYPPVQFGGWGSSWASWYTLTPAHNTVTVDGKSQGNGAGQTTLWGDGDRVNFVRASCPAMIGGQQYERTVVMVDTSPESFYLLDIFRVVGGTDHARFFGSHFGSISTRGLDLKPGEPYGGIAQMRNFRTDEAPRPGWTVEWAVEDRYGLLPDGAEVHVRYTDLTSGAEASVAENWVTVGGYDTTDEAWVPRVMTRRRAAEAPLQSTFVAVIEPCGKAPLIKSIRRVNLVTQDGAEYGDANVAVEVELADGRRDLIIAADTENPLGVTPNRASSGQMLQKQWQAATDGELAVIRKDSADSVQWIALGNGSKLSVGGKEVRLESRTEFVEREM